MDYLTFALLGGGLAAGSVSVYLVAVQGVKAAIAKEAKGIALDTVFKQFGLQRKDHKFWNELTPQGAAALIGTLQSVQQSTGSQVGGAFGASTMKALNDLNAVIAMARGVPGVGVQGPVPQQ